VQKDFVSILDATSFYHLYITGIKNHKKSKIIKYMVSTEPGTTHMKSARSYHWSNHQLENSV